MTHPDDFDPKNLGGPVPKPSPSKKPPRHRPGELFLKGPIPWAWIDRAGRLPGKSLTVGLALWFEAGCRNSPTVKMTLARLQQLGMSESTARRGLRSLHGAGLVDIDSQPGCALRVTILNPTPAQK